MSEEQTTDNIETTTATTAVVEKAPRPVAEQKPAKYGYWWGTGRRKAAVARVRIRPGDGKFVINGKEVDEYFTELRDQQFAVAPMKETDTLGKLDVFVNANGGGYTGQAGAVLLGVARALLAYDPTLEQTLRDNEFLSRDSRRVERKKPGQPGARKRFQFSKR